MSASYTDLVKRIAQDKKMEIKDEGLEVENTDDSLILRKGNVSEKLFKELGQIFYCTYDAAKQELTVHKFAGYALNDFTINSYIRDMLRTQLQNSPGLISVNFDTSPYTWGPLIRITLLPSSDEEKWIQHCFQMGLKPDPQEKSGFNKRGDYVISFQINDLEKFLSFIKVISSPEQKKDVGLEHKKETQSEDKKDDAGYNRPKP